MRGILWSIKSATMPNLAEKSGITWYFIWSQERRVTWPCWVIFASMIIVNMMYNEWGFFWWPRYAHRAVYISSMDFSGVVGSGQLEPLITAGLWKCAMLLHLQFWSHDCRCILTSPVGRILGCALYFAFTLAIECMTSFSFSEGLKIQCKVLLKIVW